MEREKFVALIEIAFQFEVFDRVFERLYPPQSPQYENPKGHGKCAEDGGGYN